MEHIKLQAGCLVLLLYIAFLYWRERGRIVKSRRLTLFDGLLFLSIFCLVFDGLTAYFVNNQQAVSANANLLLHLLFLLSLDAVIFFLFLYMRYITDGMPRTRLWGVLLWSPFIVNVLLVVLNIHKLEYRTGEISNYSMGIPAYTCYIMAGLYVTLSLGTFFRRWKYIESRKRVSVFTYLFVFICATGYQMRNPQALISSIAVTVIVLGVYLNQENPVMSRLAQYHSEMVTGFSTLIENKDGSTGGHIGRVTMYVKLLAEELQSRGIYENVLTKDYRNDLLLAAPMHDIGKIAVPDVILQKPGKLTREEFEIMKRHTVCGGKIIRDTFGHMDNAQYGRIAYRVARHHHEKWNGTGYPDGLKGDEIPLCARIMAIADVFDAVSMRRCYRDALPLAQCFEIIRAGSGQDFEPALVEVFLDMRERLTQIHSEAERETLAQETDAEARAVRGI